MSTIHQLVTRPVAPLAAIVLLAVTIGACSAFGLPIGPQGRGSAGTGAATIPIGSSAGSIESGGRTRTYRVYRPAAADGTVPTPLVVFLHGGFGTGQQAEDAYGWDAAADADNFVVAYPDGVSRAWNGGACCGQPASQDIDDVGFIRDLVTTIEAALPIDPKRIDATGISNGGIMAYRLACDTDLFAAIGPDSATQMIQCPNAAPISVIAIHGLADTRVPFDGGMGSGVGQVDGPAVPTVIAGWEARDRCAAPTSTADGDVTMTVATCPDGRAVELITIAGAGHQWPGGAPVKPAVAAILGLDQPSTAIDATSVIWRFFAEHPKP